MGSAKKPLAWITIGLFSALTFAAAKSYLFSEASPPPTVQSAGVATPEPAAPVAVATPMESPLAEPSPAPVAMDTVNTEPVAQSTHAPAETPSHQNSYPAPAARADAAPSRRPASVEAEPVAAMERKPTSKEPGYAPVPQNAVAEDDDQSNELVMSPKVGGGGKYVSFKQSGAFGGGQASAVAANELSVSTKVAYRKFHLTASLDRHSLEFSRDTTNVSLREKKTLRNISILPGYGAFFTGIKVSTKPMMQASGTSVQWADLSSVAAILGIRLEKVFAGTRKKPFRIGSEAHGSRIVSGSGNGFTTSKVTGGDYGLKFYVEKALVRRETWELFYGVEANGSTESVTVTGQWNGASGETKRTIWDVGARFYLGSSF